MKPILYVKVGVRSVAFPCSRRRPNEVQEKFQALSWLQFFRLLTFDIARGRDFNSQSSGESGRSDRAEFGRRGGAEGTRARTV